LRSSTFSPPMRPSAIRPWNFFDQGEKEWRRAIASAAMKPTLCRLFSYFGPGLPRPAISSMTDGSRRARLFLVAFLGRFAFLALEASRRGDGGDGEVAVGDGRLHVLRQGDGRDVDGIAEIGAGEIDLDEVRD